MKTAHDVKLLNGSKQEVSYTGVETVTMPGTDGQDKVFTAGAPIDAMDISPDFSGGDMPLEAPEGYVVRGATIKKPEGAEQVIAKGQTVAGITGAYVTPGTAKEITPDFSGGDQTVDAEGDERWSSVTVKKPETLVPENIPKGVEIAGVVGVKPAFTHFAVDGTGPFEINDAMFDLPPTYVRSTAFLSTSTITSVTLTEATGIGNSAFYSCTGLTTASFPACTNIGDAAFAYCQKLSQVSFPACKSIGGYAFSYCLKLSQTSFPACTSIGYGAFATCYSLTTASFPTCKSIGNYAFSNCSSLTTASFPACTSIGSYAFSNCYRLSQVSFPACKSIGGYAFAYCSSLTTASFPVCKSIGNATFAYCQKLSQVSFPACTSIGSYAFSNCYRLSQVSFPACKSIGGYAFAYCSSLTTASFPACTNIGNYAFSNCYRLISLYLLGPSFVTIKVANVFYSTPISTYSTVAGRYGSIFVRESMLASYKASNYWSLFSARMVGLTDEEIAALDAAQEETT